MGAYQYYEKTIDGIVKPFMENKPAVMLLLVFALGTGAYTALDLLGYMDGEPAPVAKEVIESKPEPKPRAVFRCPPCKCNCNFEDSELLDWMKQHEELH